jgi:hypothetical protein
LDEIYTFHGNWSNKTSGRSVHLSEEAVKCLFGVWAWACHSCHISTVLNGLSELQKKILDKRFQGQVLPFDIS